MIDSTGSTQEDLIALVGGEAEQWPHLSGLLARSQTQGRGRSGRVWNTQGVSSLTVSYVVRLQAPMQQWSTIGLRTGVGVVRALAAHGIEAMLKWPNDVVIAREHSMPGWYGIAKVGGILGSIATDSGGENVCVVGVGVNLAGDVAVEHGASLNVDVSPEGLAHQIRTELKPLLPTHAQTLEPIEDLMTKYCHTLGRQIEVAFPDSEPPRRIVGVASRIDPDGALVVDTGKTQERILHGDVAHTRLRVGLG